MKKSIWVDDQGNINKKWYEDKNDEGEETRQQRCRKIRQVNTKLTAWLLSFFFFFFFWFCFVLFWLTDRLVGWLVFCAILVDWLLACLFGLLVDSFIIYSYVRVSYMKIENPVLAV